MSSEQIALWKQKAQPQELSRHTASKIGRLRTVLWVILVQPSPKQNLNTKNEGAQVYGHWIFEILLNEKRINHGHAADSGDTITTDKSLKRLLKLYIKAGLLPVTETLSLKHIDRRCSWLASANDFLCQRWDFGCPEFKFDITKPHFRIKGFHWQAVYRGNEIIIDDFKSAKQKFKGEDEESNMQALMYSYAAKQLWPIWPQLSDLSFYSFLMTPMTVKFSDDALKGFGSFSAKFRSESMYSTSSLLRVPLLPTSNPHDGGFNYKSCLVVSPPIQTKKEGWHENVALSLQIPFEYYVIKNGDKIVSTAFKKDDLPPLKKAANNWNKLIIKAVTRYRNAIDDVKEQNHHWQKSSM